MTTTGRKPHIPRNATCVKADFSRVYFQNVRLLSAGTKTFNSGAHTVKISPKRASCDSERVSKPVTDATAAARSAIHLPPEAEPAGMLVRLKTVSIKARAERTL